MSSVMAMSQNTIENKTIRNPTGIPNPAGIPNPSGILNPTPNSNDSNKLPFLSDNISLFRVSLTHKYLINTHLTNKLSADFYPNNLGSNPYISMQKSNPLMWNHDLSDTTRLSPRFSVTPINKQTTYVGLGSYNNVGTSLKWKPTNALSLEGSAFISRQLDYNLFSQQMVYGASAMLNYNLTNKCHLNLWGQYVAPSANDPFLNKSNLFPKTNIGAELQFSPQKNLKIVTGVEYRQNQLDQKWETRSGGKVTFGF
jgi:hypothetical protein